MQQKFILFTLVASVLSLNVLVLFITPNNIGFGNIYISMVGIIIAFAGIILWFLGFLALSSSFSVFPEAKKLIKKGVYRFFKHPIYIGMVMAFLGLSIAKGSLLSVIFTILVTLPFNYYRAKREEQLLVDKFGKLYSSSLHKL